MILISPLASGYSDAPGGSARIYSRGTTSDATCYTAFDGSVSTTTHALTEMGRVKRYVNEIVDVYVYDVDGVLVDIFTFASGAQSTEVIHAHVTGTDYTTGASGLAKPSSVQKVIDKLYATFQADDFNITLGGVTMTLAAAAGSFLISGVYNVKASTYGALGDGTTNDRAAIQAAIDACAAAGGGIVLLPPGNYRITSKLDFSGAGAQKVSLCGSGSGVTTLTMDHASNTWLEFAGATAPVGWQVVSGIRFAASQVSSGYNIEYAGAMFTNYRFVDCIFGGTTTGYLCLLNASFKYQFTACRFDLSTVSSVNAGAINGGGGTGSVRVTDCDFDGPTGAWSPTTAVINTTSGGIILRGCRFNFSGTTGTGKMIDVSSAVGSCSLNNNIFIGGATTWIGMVIPTTLTGEVTFVEDANVFTGLTPYTGATSGATVGYWHLGSRRGRQIEATGSGNQVITLNMRDYGGYTFRFTSGAAATCDFRGSSAAETNPAPGCLFYLQVKNASSGTITISFTNTAVTWKSSVISPTTGNSVVYVFKYDGAVWTQTGVIAA